MIYLSPFSPHCYWPSVNITLSFIGWQRRAEDIPHCLPPLTVKPPACVQGGEPAGGGRHPVAARWLRGVWRVHLRVRPQHVLTGGEQPEQPGLRCCCQEVWGKTLTDRSLSQCCPTCCRSICYNIGKIKGFTNDYHCLLLLLSLYVYNNQKIRCGIIVFQTLYETSFTV